LNISTCQSVLIIATNWESNVIIPNINAVVLDKLCANVAENAILVKTVNGNAHVLIFNVIKTVSSAVAKYLIYIRKDLVPALTDIVG
jgi:hypothetical protein